MKITRYVQLLCATMFSLSLPALADNPISNYHYLADPATAVQGDSIFWIICDLDDESKTGYDIKAYYAFSSKDMKNWTDHGEIFRAGREVSWANAAWAPGAVWRNGKMWVYFPNGASGVGVISASNGAGPYTSPMNHLIVGNGGTVSCDGIAWCFDPGIFVDDDGQAYLTWGGGNNTARPYGNNFSVVKLKSDMYTVDGPVIKMTGMNTSFEASYITKRNGTYYLSYNNTSQQIHYATSNSPTGPWSYKGMVMGNPSINGQNINSYNNNHHGFSEFKGKWYAAYHDRRLAISNNDPTPEWHRNISIDELQYNTDGSFKSLVFTNSGPAQVGTFNPYDSIPAITSSLQKNIKSRTVVPGNGAINYSLLMPKPSKSGGSWIRLSNVNFGSGALTFKVNAASLNANNKVEIRTGSNTGTLAGTCALASTGSWTSFTNTECNVSGLTGVVSELYLNFTGSDSTAGLKWWSFSSTPPIPQGPYKDVKAVIPGKIEAENYDVGGEGVGFHDADGTNSGGVYRTDGVDITGDATLGYAVGWTALDEWLEYTVNVTTGGVYQWQARVSSGGDGAAFRVWLDAVDITGLIEVPNMGDWDTYTTLEGKTPALTTGDHVLKVVVEGAYGNLDWINIQEVPTGVLETSSPLFQISTAGTYQIFDITGVLQTQLELAAGANVKAELNKVVLQPGVYFVKSPLGNQMHQVIKK